MGVEDRGDSDKSNEPVDAEEIRIAGALKPPGPSSGSAVNAFVSSSRDVLRS